jgi:hypothetical protein
MIVLVCGGREFNGSIDCLSLFHIDIIIHGGARGADMLADRWARSKGIHCARVDALWDQLGRSAGYARNHAMAQLKPDLCVAFPGGVGTSIMIKICNSVGITVWEPYARKTD